VLARTPTQVILLDLSLPDSTGLGTVDRLQAAAPGVPIVVLTGLQLSCCDDTSERTPRQRALNRTGR
jgi:CheY-like chemotaxis protein